MFVTGTSPHHLAMQTWRCRIFNSRCCREAHIHIGASRKKTQTDKAGQIVSVARRCVSHESKMDFTDSQYRTVAIVPMVTGSFSILGSFAIVVIILRSKKGLSTTYHRLMFGMSCMDIIYSISFVGSTLPSPRGTPLVWKALGNTQTCTIQGLLFFMGSTGATMYNCILAIYYFLTITKNVRVQTMTKKIEPFFHGVPVVYLLGSSIVLLATQSFNTAGTICMIAPYPRNCNTDPNLDCIRGKQADKFFWYLNIYPIVLFFITVMYCMIRVYWSVWQQERRMQQYDTVYQIQRRSAGVNGLGTDTSSRLRPESRNERVAMTQCFLYVMAFFMSWIPGGFYRVVLTFDKNIFSLWVITQFFSPLQGVFNFLVFIRPKVQLVLRSDPSLSLFRAFINAVRTKDLEEETRRQRGSLTPGGGTRRRFTAREWHLRETANQVQLELGSEQDDDQHLEKKNTTFFGPDQEEEEKSEEK